MDGIRKHLQKDSFSPVSAGRIKLSNDNTERTTQGINILTV